MKKSGIYMITCLANDVLYVGQAVDFKNRIRYHKYQLKHQEHGNKYLQRVYDKYGIETFEFFLLFECSIDKLDTEEKRVCALFRMYFGKKVVNIRDDPSTNKGVKRTEEMKEAQSRKMKGRKAWNKGVKRWWNTPQFKKGMTPWNKGVKGLNIGNTNGFKKGMTAHNKGKSPSAESRKKMSEAAKGRVAWNKGMKKINIDSIILNPIVN